MSVHLHLKIPASTANLGVGFDSIGMALNKFLYLDVRINNSNRWSFKHIGLMLNHYQQMKHTIFIKLHSK